MRGLAIIYRLGTKELYSLLRDPVLMALIFYTFTGDVYTVARGVQTELRNAAIPVVDEDRSAVSARIASAFLPPYFQPASLIGADAVDSGMDGGHYAFVLDIPPRFEADLLAGLRPVTLLNVDATAMTTAGNGARYLQAIVAAETAGFLDRADGPTPAPVTLAIRAKFNPNLDSGWFMAVMQLINNVTILAIVLGGAAVIREREHGTTEHLVVMPVTASEIVLAKVWANGLVIVATAMLSLWLVVGGALGVPIAGSSALFAAGTAVYLFSVASLGVLLRPSPRPRRNSGWRRFRFSW